MAYYPKRTIRINQEQSKRYSEIKINKNIINKHPKENNILGLFYIIQKKFNVSMKYLI